MEITAALKRTKQQLHQSGFKLTPQREATVQVLLENEKDHLSAEEIYFLVKRKNADIGLATVYRTLEILVELKVVDKISFNDGVSRYDFRKSGEKHFHHHLLCLECGNIEEVPEDLLGKVEQVIEKKYLFTVKDHRLTFHGICRNCQKAMNKNEKTDT
ncbi:Fur family transcriptional regulator [Melissococcus plutonius]|uniref:Ferric uptake regulation protein FUR n=1 Tax=Melissococcus plutonius TaxID=33970 RepID=A0A2Z5Y218_9ENTE|nr:Fur family transcriptional regulator [Melissococcus plutonius]BAL62050.1 ferric uptake regulation protein FUR [Melissococcus plutonius DAT561]MCV2499174.1 transcriptional repressor [Melissococcus plutonius]MCV2500360.1 transcriptional repressor [Melissococcus plutonius]MCV2505153.1 transcriptional repressor [Melissococcus plutonius]MCV2507679.1 transcriptional repressor [Melissococcus plutonius]